MNSRDCDHHPHYLAKARERFDADAINSAKPDRDPQGTTDRAGAGHLQSQREMGAVALKRAAKKYLQDRDEGSSEKSADQALYKARTASWKTYKAAMITATKQNEKSLNGNREFWYD